MTKSKIGIVSTLSIENKVNKISVSCDYIDAIEKTSGIPIIIPITSYLNDLDIYIDICDGFLFTGGIDISPLNYQNSPHKNLGQFNSKLDLFQISFMKKVIASKKPFLAICRGIQVLNIACRGTLYQDLEEIPHWTIQHYQQAERYDPIHAIQINADSILYNLLGNTIYVNSFHHQCINKLGENLKISATSPDSIIEAIELDNYSFGVGVQWHPEMLLINNNTMQPLFNKLIESAKKN